MRTITLSELKSQVLNRADMKKTSFIENDELVFYINQSIAELYDLLTEKYGQDYFMKTHEFTLTDSGTHNLPSDFYKLAGVDYDDGSGEFRTMRQFMFAERNNYSESYPTNLMYRVIDGKIYFIPQKAPNNYKIKIWYIPFSTRLTLDSDTFNGYNGWEDYAIVDAAIKCVAKEEGDYSLLAREKERLTARINSVAESRDAGMPQRVQDTRNMNNRKFPWGSSGWDY